MVRAADRDDGMATSPMPRFASPDLVGGFFLVLMVCCGLFISIPFFSENVVGNYDSIFYRMDVYDAILQARSGTFPVYVGRTDFNFTGSPLIPMILFYHIFIIFDIITIHLLSVNVLFNGVIVGWGLLHVFVPYLALRLVAPRRPAGCAVLAILFALCPGNLSVLYTHDMYPTYVATPLIPVVFAAAVRMARSWEPRLAVVAGLCVAALWMLHAPSGLLMILFLGLFAAVSVVGDPGRWSRVLANAGVVAAAFGISVAWYFISVFQTGGGADSGSLLVSSELVGRMLKTARLTWPGCLLPVDVHDAMSSVQLGYAFLALMVLIVWRAIRLRGGGLTPFLVCLSVMLVMVLPVPELTRAVWRSLPFVFDIIGPVPYQRLYRFMSAILIVAAAVAWAGLSPRRGLRRAAMVAAVLAVAWSAREAARLIEYSRGLNRGAEETARDFSADRAITLPYNFFRIIDGEPDVGSVTHYDPALRNRLLAPDGRTILDNEETLVTQCRSGGPADTGWRPASSVCEDRSCRFAATTTEVDWRIGGFTVGPHGRALYSFVLAAAAGEDAATASHPVAIHILRDGLPYSQRWQSRPGRHAMPVANPGDTAARFEVIVRTLPGAGGPIRLDELCVARYDHDRLPIRPLPDGSGYRVHVDGARMPSLLETQFIHLSGFAATVNGIPVAVAPSAHNFVTVPLGRGDNDVDISYRGTPAMRVAFLVSLAGTILLIGWLARGRRTETPASRFTGP